MNFYKRYPGDYARDTGHLSLAEHGAYGLLLDRYYSTGSLPEMKRDLYNLCRANTRAERDAVDKVMAEFFDGGKNHRADEEIAKWNEKAAQNREIGKLGGRPKRNPDGNPDGSEEETQTVTERVSKENPPRSQIPEEDSERDKSLSAPPVEKSEPAPPPDPRKEIFDLGIKLLGGSAASSRGLIGKAVSQVGEKRVAEILGSMAVKPPVEPRAFFAKAIQSATKPNGTAQAVVYP